MALFGVSKAAELPAALRTILSQMQHEREAFEALSVRGRAWTWAKRATSTNATTRLTSRM